MPRSAPLGRSRALVALVALLLLFLAVAPSVLARPVVVAQSRDAQVYSGKALNELLEKCKDLRLPESPEPPASLPEKVAGAINVVAPGGIDPTIFLKAKSLKWPETIDLPKERMRLVAAMAAAVRGATKGKVSANTIKELKDAVGVLNKRLEDAIEEISPSQYIASKRFLNRVAAGIKSAEQPGFAAAVKLAIGLAKRCRTVPDLMRYMTANQLTFAPALEGDEAGYRALFTALSKYHQQAKKPARK
jgi:hypothetical protein